MKVYLVILVNALSFAKKERPLPMQLDPEIYTYTLYSLSIFCLSMYKFFILIIYQTYILILNKSNFLTNLTTSVHLQVWNIYESKEVFFLLHVFINTLKKIFKDTFYTTNDFLACPLLTIDKTDTAWYNVLSSSFVQIHQCSWFSIKM